VLHTPRCTFEPAEMSLTEERLRTWPLDQSAQERLCLGILYLDGRFAEVKPRRPKGGPDGARDIEAVFQNQKVWGAVGFRKNVRDDNEDKRWVQKKFKDDVDAAKKENPSLWGFICFTNIDLTPEEQKGLEKYAHKQLPFVELYWRERLLAALDAPRGLGFRFTYLGIPLSEEEQQAFFAEYGQALERLVQGGFSAVEKRLRRQEFLLEYQRQLMWAEVVVTLDRPVNAEELGHFRFLADIQGLEAGRQPSLWIGCRDAFWSAKRTDGSPVLLIGSKGLAWCRDPDETLQSYDYPAYGGLTTKQLDVHVNLFDRGPFPTLASLEWTRVVFWVTKPLVPFIESISLIVNDYVFAGGHREQLDILESGSSPPWIETLTDEEAKSPWVTVYQTGPKGLDDLAFSYNCWYIDFSQSTPPKKQDQMKASNTELR
jgi:hypothetical protein